MIDATARGMAAKALSTNAPANSTPNTKNVAATNLRQWFVARGKVLGGIGRAKIGIAGNSTTLGLGAGSGGTSNSNGARPFSMPVKLAALLNSNGVPAECVSALGSSALTAATYTAYDTRIVAGGGWASAAFSTVSGAGWSAAGAGTLSFTLTSNADTCDLYYPINAFGSFSWNVDGGADNTISEGGASALGKTTIPLGAAGIHTINIKWVSGTCYFIGIDPYDSTSPKVNILPMGWSGGTTSDWATTGNPWSPKTMLSAMGLDALVIDLGDNDWWEAGQGGPQIAPATVVTNLTGLIAQVSAATSVVLVIPPPSSVARSAPTTMQPYVDAIHAAFDSSVTILDLYSRFGSYTANAALYSDSVHRNKGGYATEALALLPLLLRV